MATSLDEADLGVGKADRPSNSRLTEIPSDARISDLAQQLVKEPFAAPLPPISRALLRRHPRIVAGGS